ncbi:MAG: FAD-binding protein, partial [bacterium]|nr:FAD-binding protein [bacterium]
MKSEVVVVGSGVSGLIAAIEIKKAGLDVILITKGSIYDSNSFHA